MDQVRLRIANFLTFWVSILITLISKITTICSKTNEMLKCVVKLSKDS